jgi:glutathione S-transferase
MDGQVVGPYLTGAKVTTADCHAFPCVWRLETEFGLEDFPNL